MEEAFFDTPLLRELAQLGEFGQLPDESTILRFRHRLEAHKLAEKILQVVNELLTQRGLLLKAGIAVDATLVAAPTSTKNKDKTRDPEMHSSKKGNHWHFGMKAHIGVDADSGLVHSTSVSKAKNAIEGIEHIIARQAKGRYTMLEVAEIMAAAHKLDAYDFLKMRMYSAYASGLLKLLDPKDCGFVSGRRCDDWNDWVYPRLNMVSESN